MVTGIFSACVCRRREKRSSLRALPEHRRQLGTIAAPNKENQMSSPKSTRCTKYFCVSHWHHQHKMPSSLQTQLRKLPCTSCIIPPHTGRVLQDAHCRAMRTVWGFSNDSLCCSHLTPDVEKLLAHCQCLDHSSCSLGSSPLNNSLCKFISLPKSQNTKWIQLRQSGFRSLTLHEQKRLQTL